MSTLRLGAPGIVLLFACASSPPPRPALVEADSGSASKSWARGPAPEWVLRTPRVKHSICAVGTVDPTFYRQDGFRLAGEAARNELARTLEVKVTSVMYDEQTTRGSYVDEAFVQQVIGTMSEVVLNGAQVMETWFDEEGQVSRRGMTYALACMATDQSAADLAARLSQAAPGEENEDKIQKVRERAEDMFEQLEREEDKRAGVGTESSTSTAAPSGVSPEVSAGE